MQEPGLRMRENPARFVYLYAGGRTDSQFIFIWGFIFPLLSSFLAILVVENGLECLRATGVFWV